MTIIIEWYQVMISVFLAEIFEYYSCCTQFQCHGSSSPGNGVNMDFVFKLTCLQSVVTSVREKSILCALSTLSASATRFAVTYGLFELTIFARSESDG